MATTRTADNGNASASPATEDAPGAATAVTRIVLQPLAVEVWRVPIIGVTPLVPHKWSEKARRQLREAQGIDAGKLRSKHEPKNPTEEAEAATYYLDDGKTFGFPASAFKAAIAQRLKEIEAERETLETDLRGSQRAYVELQEEMPGMPPVERYLLALAAGIDDRQAQPLAGVKWEQDVEHLMADEEFKRRYMLASRPPYRYQPPFGVRLSGTDPGSP